MLTNVILGMCAGRWGRNGSSRRRIISPRFAKVRCRRDRSFCSLIMPAGSPQIHNIGACKSLQKEQGSILDFAPFLCSGACVAPSSFFMHLHAPILIGTVLRQKRAASVENEI